MATIYWGKLYFAFFRPNKADLSTMLKMTQRLLVSVILSSIENPAIINHLINPSIVDYILQLAQSSMPDASASVASRGISPLRLNLFVRNTLDYAPHTFE